MKNWVKKCKNSELYVEVLGLLSYTWRIYILTKIVNNKEIRTDFAKKSTTLTTYLQQL